MCTIMGSQREGQGEHIEVPVHLPQSRTHVCSGSLPFWATAPHVMMVNQQINRLQMGCTQEVA